ncbi:MAG: SidA/IucD/PvdA family monooxygenase, partial [Actinobacteria bacterium]|nr:SidA/IucD/PvdA family monooxygenase [Actinomycetota bacterium]
MLAGMDEHSGALGEAVRVVVVGGGASGVLLAARLLDASFAKEVHVSIVEPSGRLAAGVAYGTDDPEHLLNVRASGMSADPSRPSDLVDWMAARSLGGPDTFLPRREFREYLLQHLELAAARAQPGSLEVLQDQVVALEPSSGRTHVRLSSGKSLTADFVVLAIGNPAPGIPDSLKSLAGTTGWVPDPWAPEALQGLQGKQRIALVGTGLTMADVALTLSRQSTVSKQLKLIALSRNGLLPKRHLVKQPQRPMQVIDLAQDAKDVLSLQAKIHARIQDRVGAEYPDENWREVIDAIRPFANALWRRFDDTQQSIFLSHVLRDWDVHRHRMSPPTAGRLAGLISSGVMTTHVGQVLQAANSPEGEIDLGVEMNGSPQQLYVDAVVNCTGPGRSWLPPANPVVTDLMSRGLAQPDPHGLGLMTTAQGSLLGQDG